MVGRSFVLGEILQKKLIYTLNYWLKNDNGDVVDTSEGGESMVFIDGSKNVIQGMHKAVEGRKEGDKLEVLIPPELAYGKRLSELVSIVPVSSFDGVHEVEKGMKFQTNRGGSAQVVHVTKVENDNATIDANHPLAGLSLNFDIEILEIREATELEILADQDRVD